MSEAGNREGISWARMAHHHGEFAAWLLRLMDASPNKVAVIEVSGRAVRDLGIGAIEETFGREYDRAKRERPDLSIKLRGPHPDHPDAALLVAVHEHEWVGGHCVRGCGTPQDS